MDQNVVFEKPQNQNKSGSNATNNDPLDPFAKAESVIQPQTTASTPVSPVPPTQNVPSSNQPMSPTPPPSASPSAPQPTPPNPSSGNPAVPPTSPPSPPPVIHPGMPSWIKIALGVFAVILFLIIISMLFSHRGSSTNQGKVTLEYWGLWESPAIMNTVLADFERKYPNITVNYKQEDPKGYNERLLAHIKNGDGPDIFRYHNSWIPELSSVLAPLSTDAITPTEFKKDFYPVAQTDLMQNGAIYGIPLEIDTLSLFVNNNILKAAGLSAPTTWEAFVADARAVTVKDENNKIKTAGAAMGTYDNINHASDIVAMLFAQNGANLTNIGKTSANASDALTFYTAFAKDDGNVWDNTLDPSLTAFASGNLGLYFGTSWDIFQVRVMNPTLDFSIYPVPHLPGRPYTIANYWVEGVSVKTKHPKETMLLMHYLAQKDTEEKLYTAEAKTRPFGEPYARVDLADTLKQAQLLYPFVSQAKTAVSTYFSSNTYDTGINAQMNGYLGNAVRSILTNTSTDTAVKTLDQGVSQVLQQYGIQPPPTQQ